MQEQVHLEQSSVRPPARPCVAFLACQNSILEEGKKRVIERGKGRESGRGRIQVEWGKEVPPKSETPQFVERV